MTLRTRDSLWWALWLVALITMIWVPKTLSNILFTILVAWLLVDVLVSRWKNRARTVTTTYDGHGNMLSKLFGAPKDKV